MSKNTALDLNDHLFAELERLGDEDLSGEALSKEIIRARCVADIAHEVICNHRNVLKAEELKKARGMDIPKILAGDEPKKEHPVFKIAMKEG